MNPQNNLPENDYLDELSPETLRELMSDEIRKDKPSIKFIKALLNAGVPADASDEYGYTPLHEAAYRGQAKVVKLLLSRGCSINQVNFKNTTPLHAASISGQYKVVKILLAHGADYLRYDATGKTPLHAAAEFNHADVIKLLVKHGAPVDLRTSVCGSTPLHIAAQSYDVDIDDSAFEKLLKLGADYDAVSHSGETAILNAMFYGITSYVELLISSGASLNVKNHKGQSPLHWALSQSHVSVSLLKMLLKNGAPKDVKDADGKTPWDIASDDIRMMFPNLKP